MSSSDYLIKLVEEKEPLDIVWQWLNDIWIPEKNIKEYYSKGEEASNEIEGLLRETFFEIYDILHDRILKWRPVVEPPLIIMDGFSIREGSLVRERLKNKVMRYEYAFSSLPSTTEGFSKKVFNAQSASLVKGDFTYKRVVHGKIPFDFLDEKKFVIWVSYPDELFHPAPLPFEKAFEETFGILLEILKRIGGTEKVTIMADHGYIFADNLWYVEEYAPELKSIFGVDRFAPVSNLSHEEWRMAKDMLKDLVKIGDKHCFVKGRWMWPAPGRKGSVVHGGLSLMECILPVLEVRL